MIFSIGGNWFSVTRNWISFGGNRFSLGGNRPANGMDWSFFDKLSATKGKLKNSCLLYEYLIQNGYIYTVRIAFLSNWLPNG